MFYKQPELDVMSIQLLWSWRIFLFGFYRHLTPTESFKNIGINSRGVLCL